MRKGGSDIYQLNNLHLKPMKETEYAYASAYVRTLEKRMLGKADIEALLNMTSPSDALKYLSDKGYGNNKSGKQLDADLLLKEELTYSWNEAVEACPEGSPMNILLYPNDFHNVKTILKSVFSGETYEDLTLDPHTISPVAIHRAISSGKPDSLPDPFKLPAVEAYNILSRDGDGQLAEIVLDKALFNAIHDLAHQSKSSFLIGWVNLNVDLINMKIAIRTIHQRNVAAMTKSKKTIRNSMLDCANSNADALADAAYSGDISVVLKYSKGFEQGEEYLSAFERWCDNELIAYVQTARYKILGFEPVFAFLVGKQFELQTVRIILSGIRNGTAKEILRERLRNSYV